MEPQQIRLDSMPRTLAEAHEALTKVRPGRAASLSAWRAFRLLAARVYTEMADIDRFHHHEGLYWASYERGQAEEVTRQLALANKTRSIPPSWAAGAEGE